MSASPGKSERDVVPRWRRFGVTVVVGELNSLHEPNPRPVSTVEFDDALHAFKADPGLYTAGDALARAMILGIGGESVQEVAQFVLSDPLAPGRLAYDLADRLLKGETSRGTSLDRHPLYEPAAFKVRISQMRRILRREPQNAIRWADLALAHVNLGQMDAAKRAMRVALNLAPSNRYVVRAAVRLYVLLGEPDRARSVFADRAVLHDPWIHASELAVSQILDQPSRDLRAARRAIEDQNFAPWHLSELAGELATMELRSGKLRQARRLISKALVSPTENTLAQIEWAAAVHGGVDSPAERVNDEPPLTFEAKARAEEQAGNFEAALAHGREWQVDQPFDPDPALFASYIASMALEQYDIAVEVAERGLLANPDNVVLRNNLVFALASSGAVAGAKHEVAKLGLGSDASERATVIATRGLVAFRLGQITEGRSNYQASVDMFLAEKDYDRVALATLFWAREEIVSHTPEAANVLARAKAAVERSGAHLARVWESRVTALAERATDRLDKR